MVDLQYLSALAERTVSIATHAGADRCDVVAADTDTISVDLEKGSVKQANIFSDPGVGVRAFVKGASGFAVCTGFDDAAVSRAAAMAVSLARAGPLTMISRTCPWPVRSGRSQGYTNRGSLR